MSWSVSYAGKLKDAKKASKQSFKGSLVYLKSNPTYADEAKVCELARKLVAFTLRHLPVDSHVSVQASGHQSGTWDGEKYVNVTQTVKVSIEPIAPPVSV